MNYDSTDYEHDDELLVENSHGKLAAATARVRLGLKRVRLPTSRDAANSDESRLRFLYMWNPLMAWSSPAPSASLAPATLAARPESCRSDSEPQLAQDTSSNQDSSFGSDALSSEGDLHLESVVTPQQLAPWMRFNPSPAPLAAAPTPQHAADLHEVRIRRWMKGISSSSNDAENEEIYAAFTRKF